MSRGQLIAGAVNIVIKGINKLKIIISGKKRPEKAREKAESDDKPVSGRKLACKGCRRINRRHDPCRAKGKSPSKAQNTMIDPDVSDSVSAEIDDIIAGNVNKVGQHWITKSGRRFAEHDGTLFPVDGPGLVNFDRLQHQYNVRLNTVGFEQANYELERRGSPLSEEKKRQVEQLWQKCKK